MLGDLCVFASVIIKSDGKQVGLSEAKPDNNGMNPVNC